MCLTDMEMAWDSLWIRVCEASMEAAIFQQGPLGCCCAYHDDLPQREATPEEVAWVQTQWASRQRGEVA